MPKHKKDKHAQSVNQGVGAKQAVNPVVSGVQQAVSKDNKAFQQHDASNRLGDYEGTGNHARTGNRGHQ